MTKLVPSPTLKPLDKDAVIEDLKRKLTATEHQLELSKELRAEDARSAFKYWCELQYLKGLDIK